MRFGRIIELVISFFLPRRCPICDRPVKPYGALACDDCISKVRYVSEPTCYKCGKPLDDETREYCEDCSRRRHLYKRGYALFEYKSVSDSIYRFKYKNRQEYARWYGEVMARVLGPTIKSLDADALIPVPIHKTKMRSRGYNQASLIAGELSRQLGIPIYDKLIIRDKKTTPLKDLTPEQRNNILRGAFKLTRNDVKLRTIVIIDDIYTTGATIDAVAWEFLQSNISQNIYFITLAIGKGL